MIHRPHPEFHVPFVVWVSCFVCLKARVPVALFSMDNPQLHDVERALFSSLFDVYASLHQAKVENTAHSKPSQWCEAIVARAASVTTLHPDVFGVLKLIITVLQVGECGQNANASAAYNAWYLDYFVDEATFREFNPYSDVHTFEESSAVVIESLHHIWQTLGNGQLDLTAALIEKALVLLRPNCIDELDADTESVLAELAQLLRAPRDTPERAALIMRRAKDVIHSARLPLLREDEDQSSAVVQLKKLCLDVLLVMSGSIQRLSERCRYYGQSSLLFLNCLSVVIEPFRSLRQLQAALYDELRGGSQEDWMVSLVLQLLGVQTGEDVVNILWGFVDQKPKLQNDDEDRPSEVRDDFLIDALCAHVADVCCPLPATQSSAKAFFQRHDIISLYLAYAWSTPDLAYPALVYSSTSVLMDPRVTTEGLLQLSRCSTDRWDTFMRVSRAVLSPDSRRQQLCRQHWTSIMPAPYQAILQKWLQSFDRLVSETIHGILLATSSSELTKGNIVRGAYLALACNDTSYLEEYVAELLLCDSCLTTGSNVRVLGEALHHGYIAVHPSHDPVVAQDLGTVHALYEVGECSRYIADGTIGADHVRQAMAAFERLTSYHTSLSASARVQVADAFIKALPFAKLLREDVSSYRRRVLMLHCYVARIDEDEVSPQEWMQLARIKHEALLAI